MTQTYTTVQNFRNTDAYVYALNYEYLLASVRFELAGLSQLILHLQ